MIILLSPAKIQNFKQDNQITTHSKPLFMKEAQCLVELIRELNASELSKLLDINATLTQLNIDRYFNWHLPFSLNNAKQAALVFDGEVYRGLNAGNFTASDFEYAQQHLLLFSGLYGILRPLDLIQPYRLEVSSKLKNQLGNDLYSFWRDKITLHINSLVKKMGKSTVIINLASSEYMKTLNINNINARIVDIEFYEYKNDQFKQIVIYTKKARGLMASHIIKNKIEDVEDIKGFSEAGYWFSPQMSTENKLVFTR